MAYVQVIVSMGREGAERGALEAALALGIPCGGHRPKGLRAGNDLDRLVKETDSSEHSVALRLNVDEADGTLMFSTGTDSSWDDLTASVGTREKKPVFCMEFEEIREQSEAMRAELLGWVRHHQVRILNVIGPSESAMPGMQVAVLEFLRQTFRRPTTIEEAAGQLVEDLSDDAREDLCQLEEEDLPSTYFELGPYVKNEYGLDAPDGPLQDDGQRHSCLVPDDVAYMIVEKAWKRLRATGKPE